MYCNWISTSSQLVTPGSSKPMSLDDVRARTFAIPGLPRFALPNPDGRFSVAGRVDDKGIQFLFIAEYYRGNRPLCTQSWNASGPRQ